MAYRMSSHVDTELDHGFSSRGDIVLDIYGTDKRSKCDPYATYHLTIRALAHLAVHSGLCFDYISRLCRLDPIP
jgi:hypothetical protein